MNDSKNFEMDELLNNHSKGEITAYFGSPLIDCQTLNIFKRKDGKIAVIFEKNTAIAYALYKSNGVQIYSAKINTIKISAESFSEYEGTSITNFVKKYGIPHADIGSGRTIPIYLSDHSSIYKIIEVGGKIKKIIEIIF